MAGWLVARAGEAVGCYPITFEAKTLDSANSDLLRISVRSRLPLAVLLVRSPLNKAATMMLPWRLGRVTRMVECWRPVKCENVGFACFTVAGQLPRRADFVTGPPLWNCRQWDLAFREPRL